MSLHIIRRDLLYRLDDIRDDLDAAVQKTFMKEDKTIIMMGYLEKCTAAMKQLLRMMNNEPAELFYDDNVVAQRMIDISDMTVRQLIFACKYSYGVERAQTHYDNPSCLELVNKVIGAVNVDGDCQTESIAKTQVLLDDLVRNALGKEPATIFNEHDLISMLDFGTEGVIPNE